MSISLVAVQCAHRAQPEMEDVARSPVNKHAGLELSGHRSVMLRGRHVEHPDCGEQEEGEQRYRFKRQEPAEDGVHVYSVGSYEQERTEEDSVLMRVPRQKRAQPEHDETHR